MKRENKPFFKAYIFLKKGGKRLGVSKSRKNRYPRDRPRTWKNCTRLGKPKEEALGYTWPLEPEVVCLRGNRIKSRKQQGGGGEREKD